MQSARYAFAVLITGVFLVVAISNASAGELTLKRVLLSTGGVGYFEYEAEVDGPAQLALTVRRDQVDDVLKSLVVYDDKGSVGAVDLAGDQPLVDAFRELPFDRTALANPALLLNALRGAEVIVGGPKEVRGRILAAVADAPAVSGNIGATLQHRLTLMTAQGLQSIVLENAEAVRFVDPKLEAQVTAALAAEAANADKERRRLTLQTTGAGHRLVRVAFLAEVPLWKASYRLTLEPGEVKTAALQGWAVVENRSGADWNGIELSLVSGDPVTFRQALYATYYVKRPEVPVEVLGRILPPADSGAIAGKAASSAVPGMIQNFAASGTVAARGAGSMLAGVPAQSLQPEPKRLAEIAAAEPQDSATQVNFRLPQSVILKNGDTMLTPIIARAVRVARVALYQPMTDATHPLAAVEVSNDSDAALPPGVLTLYERSAAGRTDYVGDARLNPLPAGERRLLSFALDRKIRVDRSVTSATRTIKGRIADGVLEFTTADQQHIVYTIAASPNEARHLLIEVPRPGGDWAMTEPDAKQVEVTNDAWRLKRELAAGQTIKFEVTLERPGEARFELGTLSPERIAYFAASSALNDAQRKALAKLGTLAGTFADQQRKLSTLEQQQRDLVADQGRARSNLGAVPKGSDAERRYLKMLNDQEDGLAKLSTEIETVRQAQDVARNALNDYIKGLKL